MKIGIDARFVGPQGTGLGKYTEKLVSGLAEIDKKNQYVIFLRKNNWNYLKVGDNFQKTLADIPWYSAKEQIFFPKVLNSQNLDLLHVPHFNVPVFYKKKFIVTIHDLIHHRFSETSATTKNFAIFKLKRLAYQRVISRAVKKSAKIITPSNFVKEEVAKNFNIAKDKIVVTYEAAEEEYFNRKPSTINRQPILIYVGNAYPHKNLNNLLDAIKLLTTHYSLPTTHLILVCPRDIFWDRLEGEIKSRNLEKNVELKGYLKAQELKKLFQKATTYVFPSLSEGFGIPGLNAMASGLPVIASDIPTLKEIYEDAAIYFNPENAKDMAEKIKKVLSDSTTRSDLVEKGQAQVKKYSWEKMAKETLKVYESV